MKPTRSSWSTPRPTIFLQRLREGKVYVKAQAERALKHFFSPGNLTALRELALRKAAQHVDRDMVDYMQAHAIGGPWPAGERILVCINEHPSSAELVRRGRRLADSLKATWTALYVEGPRHLNLNEVEKDRVADTLRLAQRLGAETATLPGRDIARHDPRICAQQQCHADPDRKIRTLALVRAAAWLGGPRSDAPERRHQRHRRHGGRRCRARRKPSRPRRKTDGSAWRNYAWSALAVAATVAVAWVLNAFTAHALGSVGMLFLVPVLISAVSFGLRPALFTAFVSVMAYNFFFLPPLYTFTIRRSQQLAVLRRASSGGHHRGNLAARVRAQADLAAARAAIAGELYQFHRQARGNRPAGRHPLGGGLSDCLHAEDQCRDPACQTPRPSGWKSASAIRRRTNWMPRTSPPPPGAGNGEQRQAAMPKRCLARSGCFFPCAPAGAGRRHWLAGPG